MADAPHVVICPNSAPGHTTPFLQFARRLAGEGVVITLVSSDRHIQELKILLGTSTPLRLVGLLDNQAHLSNAEWRKPLTKGTPEELRVVQLLCDLVTEISSPESLQLRGVPPAGGPVCVIYDTFNIWAQTAAKQLGIESHLLWVSPACSLSCSLEYPGLFQDGRLPITKETRDKVICGIPGLPPTRAMDLPSPGLDVSASFSSMQKRYSHVRNADVIMINTCYALEKSVLDALSRYDGVGTPELRAKYVFEIGPLLPESYVCDDGGGAIASEEADPCISWLNTQAKNSVLYVSFGSYATPSAAQLVEMALGLEASGSPFLWIVKPPDAGETSAAIGGVLSVKEYLPVGFEDRVKGRGMCYSGWAPQMRILKHPAVGGFLSHCGWNSSLETVGAGVPVVAWPMGAEQHLIRRCFVSTLKVAIELEANAYTKEELESDVPRPGVFMSKEEIERKVRTLMQEVEGQVVRENIQKLKADCREAVAAGGSSPRNLEIYVRYLQSSSYSTKESNVKVKLDDS